MALGAPLRNPPGLNLGGLNRPRPPPGRVFPSPLHIIIIETNTDCHSLTSGYCCVPRGPLRRLWSGH